MQEKVFLLHSRSISNEHNWIQKETYGLIIASFWKGATGGLILAVSGVATGIANILNKEKYPLDKVKVG